MAMTREQIDELLNKDLRERRAMAFGEEVTVLTWHGEDRDHVAGCLGRFDVGNTTAVWHIDALSPIDPPEPTRVRFEIGRKGSAYSAASDVEDVYAQSSIDYTHEANLDDCGSPGDSLPSLIEMTDNRIWILPSTDRKHYCVRADEALHATLPHDGTNEGKRAAMILARKHVGQIIEGMAK